MMNNQQFMRRRTFLRGAGTCLALPWFASLQPRLARAAETSALQPPLRSCFVYFPNGVNVAQWTPEGAGQAYSLSPTLEPLAGLRDHFQVISGLEHENATAGRDGAGDHARANAVFLTGARPRKTGGADIQVGISVDQFAAQTVGHRTRFPSLEVSCDGVHNSGVCDSGYSCAYQFNLSWRNATTPSTPECNPRLVFERLFGNGKGAASRMTRNKSILDFVIEDAEHLDQQLGYNDRHKLGEYLAAVRSIERRIEHAEQFPTPVVPDQQAPLGIPEKYADHIRMMYDLLILAFQTDSTRIASFLLAHDGSNRSFNEIDVPDGHHTISHHNRDPEKLRKIAIIDKFYTQQFAYFLERLRDTSDGDGQSLLHNSMIVYGSGISDADRHDHDNLPILLAGHGSGRLQPGRHLQLASATPMSNLYLAMLQHMGVPADDFGDSTGVLSDV